MAVAGRERARRGDFRKAIIQALQLGGLFVASLALRAYPALAMQFDGLYGQDPYAYYSYGQQIREAVAQFRLPGKFYWPLGYPAVVGLGLSITPDNPLGPQILTLIAGAMVSVLAFLLTVEVARAIMLPTGSGKPDFYNRLLESRSHFPVIAGLIAWGIVAVCGQLIQSSFVVMADAPALMWATLSAWAIAIYGRKRHPFWIALSAFALAWATMTRWQYGSLAVVWAGVVIGYQLPTFRRRFTPAFSPLRLGEGAGGEVKRFLTHASLAVVVGLITLSPQIAHTLQNPDPLIGHQWVQGWSISNAFLRDFTTVDGTFHYADTPAVYYAQPLYNPYYMSPLFLALIVVGLILVIRRPAPLILLIGWIIVQYGFLAGIPYQNIRFALAEFPPLAVLAGLGGTWIMTAPIWRSWRIVVRPLMIAFMVTGLLTTLKASIPYITDFIAAKNNDLAATLWIDSQIKETGASVYCLDLLLTMQHYTRLNAIQIYELTPDVLKDQLVAQSKPAYAVFNLWTTEHQWYGKSPWIIYHWLDENPGLTRIGAFGNYTLFRIGKS